VHAITYVTLEDLSEELGGKRYSLVLP